MGNLSSPGKMLFVPWRSRLRRQVICGTQSWPCFMGMVDRSRVMHFIAFCEATLRLAELSRRSLGKKAFASQAKLVRSIRKTSSSLP